MKPFGTSDKVGYLFGDLGNDLFFLLASNFLMIFYTRVLGVAGAVVGTLFLVARFVDAVTDITMGRLVDSRRSNEGGRFKPWIKWMSLPVVLAGILLFIPSAAKLPYGWKLVYIYVTYLLWGSVCYTGINIPYGSMASAITDNPVERTSLSTFRSMGAALAGVLIGSGVSFIIYAYDTQGNQIVLGQRFLPLALVFGGLALVCYYLCYRLCHERVEIAKRERDKRSVGEVVLGLVRNRSLMAIIAAAIVLLLSLLLTGTMNNFLFMDYFKNKEAMAVAGLLQTAATLLLAPFAAVIAKRFGKKEASGLAVLSASVVYFVLFFLRVRNPWVFCVFVFFGNLGSGLFNLMIWAFITDVIDQQELMTGVREDGTVYAVYSFARKIGQALAGGLGGYALTAIGYISSTDNVAQPPEVVARIYAVATLSPAIGYLLVALVLLFWYPLGRRLVAENSERLKALRAGAQ